MRSLHDVAVAFFVGDDAHIVPRAGNMPVPAALSVINLTYTDSGCYSMS